VTVSWQNYLLNPRELFAPAETAIRFGLPWVPVSTIAEQFYCEAKVDLEYNYGRIPTPAKEEGTELHQEIIEMEPTTPKDLVESIAKKPILLCTFPVYGKVGDIPFMGMPDAVLFQNSKPSQLIELKTTNGDVTRLWRDQAVQVKAYGLALDSMGFECRDLRLSLVRVNKEGITDEVKEQLLGEVAFGLLSGGLEAIEQKLKAKSGGRVKIHPITYSREDALKDVIWARDYWTMKREAIPTTVPSKCRVCEFNTDCPYSLAKEPRT
jgi:PD-(D/E)XK nuclease superfamily